MIDVDSPLTVPNPADSRSGTEERSHDDGKLFRRSRVVIKEIGEQTTRKNRWHVTLLRHKHFDTVRIQSKNNIRTENGQI